MIELNNLQLTNLILDNYPESIKYYTLNYINNIKNKPYAVMPKYKDMKTEKPEMFYDELFWELLTSILVNTILVTSNLEMILVTDHETYEFIKLYEKLLNDKVLRVHFLINTLKWKDIIYGVGSSKITIKYTNEE